MQKPDGTVKLLDFGIARATTEASSLTQSGMAMGSFYYMSPEQVRAETVGPQSDLYSTGIMFFEMLVGQRPFQGSAATVLQAHLQKDPPVPTILNPSVPEVLSLIVRKALEKETTARYQTADEFRDALLTAQKSLGADVANPVWTPVDRRAELPTLPLKAQQTPAHTTNKGVLFDPIGLERLRQEIAPHIGPLAKVIVDRAAKRCQSWDELYKTLASEVPAGKQRDRFLLGKPSS
jgi:serine/threonine-protein kinase